VTSLEPIDAPIELEPLAARVRASSNFRFSWQWFSCPPSASTETGEVRRILEAVIDRPDCHAFLNDSRDPGPFTIERLHEHVGFAAADGSFEQALARAAADQLGAYSRTYLAATPDQAKEIRDIFGALGPYRAFELTPGNVVGCSTCKHHNSHVFSSWFYGVAWDWLFCVRWTERPFAWIGCLSDTD
jgi:hypothetical protein